MKIEESKKGGRFHHVLVLALDGRLGAETSDALQSQLFNALERGEKSILLNLSKLEHVSSAGMRVFLIMAKRLERDGRFAVCSLNHSVAEVFRVSGFESILDIFPDEASALAALK